MRGPWRLYCRVDLYRGKLPAALIRFEWVGLFQLLLFLPKHLRWSIRFQYLYDLLSKVIAYINIRGASPKESVAATKERLLIAVFFEADLVVFSGEDSILLMAILR